MRCGQVRNRYANRSDRCTSEAAFRLSQPRMAAQGREYSFADRDRGFRGGEGSNDRRGT